MSIAIKIRDEDTLSREVLRALRFFEIQIKKGWTIQEALEQIENSYGDRVLYFVLLSFLKNA